MNIIAKKLAEGFCRIEQGVFLSNGEVVLLAGSPQEGFQVANRTTADLLIALDPDGWCVANEADPKPLVQTEEFSVRKHQGAMEGEGFISLFDSNGQLNWICRFDSSEEFDSAKIIDGLIIADSSEYPLHHQWRIPITELRNLTVVSRTEVGQ